jgi:hypothetical protein
MPDHEKNAGHVGPDDLTRQDLAATVMPPPRPHADGPGSGSATTEKHGTRDARLAARQRSEQARSGRASGSGRVYAFRRS